MFNWREAPFVRLLIPLIIGIALGLYINSPLHALNMLIALFFLFIAWLTHRRLSPQTKDWFSGLVQVCLLFLGYQLAIYHNDYHSDLHFRHALEDENVIIGIVKEVKISDRYIKTTLAVEQIGHQKDSNRVATGHILLFIDHADVQRVPAYGDRLIVSTKISPVEGPRNPEAFDYRRFLQMKGIYHQGRVSETKWAPFASHLGNPVIEWTSTLRQTLICVLQIYLPTENEFSVGAAMLLGYRDNMGEDISNAYAGTGAMHVMAVSGLHIGLVFLGLGMLLRLLYWRNTFMQLLKPMLLLLGIWIFALLSGASPSAMRAAFMFSLIIIGQSLQREGNIYNTLAASAFCLLCFNPFLLMEVGFQLSYLAVGGIVYFQPKVFKLWYIENRLGKYLWTLASVGFAAQLTTFPLSLFYFHQFPLYFWLSGLVVVPAAMLVIGLGALLFVSHYFLPFVSAYVGKLLLYVIAAMNGIIFLIRKLPAGLIEGIWVSIGVFILLYFLISFVIIAINSGRLRWVVYALGVLAAITGTTAFTNIRHQQQAQIVIYHTPRHTMIDCIQGNTAIQFCDPLLSQKGKSWASENYRTSKGIRKVTEQLLTADSSWQNAYLKYQPPFMQFHNYRMAFIDALPLMKPSTPIELDYLLLYDNPNCQVRQLLDYFAFDTLLIDASNRNKNTRQWIKDCLEAKIPYRSVSEEGALILYPKSQKSK